MAMGSRCPSAGDVGNGLVPTFMNLCSEWLEIGRLDAEGLAGWPMGSCMEKPIQDAITFVSVESAEFGTGILAEFCRDGATTPADICQPACEVLGICIAPDTPASMGGGLRDSSICRYRCGVRSSPSTEVWSCVAQFSVQPDGGGSMASMGGMPAAITFESPECGQALNCFQQ